MVIFCGHFPDGAEKFTPDVLEHETRAEWYLRQMLGAANFKAGPLLAFSSGNLCYQIEHHLFPDLPSNRYAADRRAGAGAVREVRPAVHHRFACAPVSFDAADHPQTGASRRLSGGHLRRRAGNCFGAEVRYRRYVTYRVGWPDDRASNCVAGPVHADSDADRRAAFIGAPVRPRAVGSLLVL